MRKIINKKIAKLLNCYIVTMEGNNSAMQQYNNGKSQKGFTLVELLIVIAVMGVLTGSLVILINPATQLSRARDTQRKSDLSRLQSAIEIYRADLGIYPAALPLCGIDLTGGTPPSTYMARVPCDPLSPPPTPYRYVPNATFTSYCMRACLENTQDKNRDELVFGANNPNNAATGCDFAGVDNCPAVKRSYTVLRP